MLTESFSLPTLFSHEAVSVVGPKCRRTLVYIRSITTNQSWTLKGAWSSAAGCGAVAEAAPIDRGSKSELQRQTTLRRPIAVMQRNHCYVMLAGPYSFDNIKIKELLSSALPPT